MITYLRQILGTYAPIEGVDGIGCLNVEYIVQAILLIMSVWLAFKLIVILIRGIFKV